MFVEYYQGTNIMLEDFLSYIVEELSVNRADKLLLAVSGGVDSMVMLDLFHKSGFDIQVAHINHSTRNGQSDLDEKFVISTCERLEVPYSTKVFDYNELAKGNFQANARKARYEFFDAVMSSNNMDYLATAHHMDDRWETFMMNLNRKSGITGLTSLKPKIGSIVRPLLCFTRQEIEKYALDNNIEFAEDASNDTDDYTRNKVRHHLTTAAKDIFPDFIKNVNKSIDNLEKSNRLIGNLIQSGDYVTASNQRRIIDLEKVKLNVFSIDLLFHIVSSCGFTHSDTCDMLATKSTGAMFRSSTHEALHDRGRLIIRAKRDKRENTIELRSDGKYELQDGRFIIFKNGEKSNEKDILNFSYPIKASDSVILRSLKPGDKYKPEHMNGKTKTLKKLLSDLKVDRFAKEDILVLEINGEIKKIIGVKDKKS